MSYTKYIGNLNTHRGLLGKIGEDFACEYLISKGHEIVNRNLKIKLGEIDVISFYKNTLHFTEVKTVSTYTGISAEEHLDYKKLRKIGILAEIYYKNYVSKIEKQSKDEIEISLNFIGVYLDQNKKLEKINFIESLEI